MLDLFLLLKRIGQWVGATMYVTGSLSQLTEDISVALVHGSPVFCRVSCA